MFNNPYGPSVFHVPNLFMPYNGDIPEGLTAGKKINIGATVPPYANGFCIHLLNNQGHAFTINPRYGEGAIVLNTEQHGSWGQEERHSNMHLFHRGQSFEMVISVEHDRYRVTVNGHHAFDFRHRVPCQNVVRIALDGDLHLNKLSFVGGSSSGSATHNPHLPFSTPVVNGAAPGRMIKIAGNVNHHASQFLFQFQDGPGHNSQTIPFVFNPRFNENEVVRNNCVNGNWQNEERQASHFPFFRGSAFEILVLIEHNEVKVAVNGQHFITFAHRAPMYQFNHLLIQGDVAVTSVNQW